MISSKLAKKSGPVRRALFSLEAALAIGYSADFSWFIGILDGMRGEVPNSRGRRMLHFDLSLKTFFEILHQGFVEFDCPLWVFSEAFFGAAELT